MKRTFSLITIVLCVAMLPLQHLAAQDFKLWFANNVSDVSDLENITSSNELNWHEAKNGDMAGNQAEVYQLQQMLASTSMKGLAQQQQFWTMRDHSLLCFRIDNVDKNKHATYEVEVENLNTNDKLSLTVTQFFFVNAPLTVKPRTEYAITVKKVGDPSQCIRFRYNTYDWNNDNLYIFQLDRKRQLTGKEYSLEYVTGYMDEDGFVQKETFTLPLKEKSFQSFYLPEGRDLLDVILVGDENKLRINKNRLHPGVDLEDRYSRMSLSPGFMLDKHQGREFINFNWLGSGLFEKYDTLYLALFNQRSQPIRSATIHVEQVDENGKPTHSRAVKYLGYDNKSGAHRILTMGKPAYIEILASGSYPTVYRYPGAADEETGFVSEDRCSKELTLRTGRWNAKDLVISSHRFLNLYDERMIIIRNGIDHRLCSVQEMELTGRAPVDTVTYLVDCGNSFPKLLDNKPIERFAQMEITFSRPKGGVTPNSSLLCSVVPGGVTRTAQQIETTIVSANDFTSFSRDYYFTRYDLIDAVSKGDVVRLTLNAGNESFDRFPMLCSSNFDRETANKLTEEYANNNCTGEPPTAEEQEANEARAFTPFQNLNLTNNWLKRSMRRAEDELSAGDNVRNGGFGDAFADVNLDLALPFKLKFHFRPIDIATTVKYDFLKQILSFNIIGQFNRGDNVSDSAARDELRNEEKKEMWAPGGNEYVSGNLTDGTVEVDRWVNADIEDMFDMTSNRVGRGWFGGFAVGLRTPITEWSKFQLTEARGNVGYGQGFSWPKWEEDPKFEPIVNLLEKAKGFVQLSVGAVAELNAEAQFGVHSYDQDVKESMNGKNMGYFFQFGAKAKAGIALEVGLGDTDSLNLLPLANFKLGVRGGGKVGGFVGVEGPFAAIAPCLGFRGVAMIAAQAYFSLNLIALHISGDAGFRVGGQFLAPDDDTNPFHKDFPYWLNTDARSVGGAFRKVEAPDPGEFGRELINDVAIDANPHFLDGHTIVYNDLRKPKDYNDNTITVHNMETGKSESISKTDMSATNHMRSKRGDHEVVVYEQTMKQIDNASVTDENALASSIELMQGTRIHAAFRDGDGEWRTTYVTGGSDEENDGMTDQKPVVTIQDDGKAACIYQHGKLELVNSGVKATEDNPLAEIGQMQYAGHLMLRTFDGTKWSKPLPLFATDEHNRLGKYDLIMRDDTVLVAAMYSLDVEGFDKPRMMYVSKPLAKEWADYEYDPLNVDDFFMMRVGQNAVVAMTYEATDSIRDIYVKTLDMDGTNDGRMGSDLGLDRMNPTKVKIICDRSATKLDDFAVMWTENNNNTRNEDGSTVTGEMRSVLNASHIHLANAPLYTAPITLGAELDSVLVLTDYDGFLDDDSIKVVYTLSDVKTGAAVIMQNGKAFANSFEHEVSYTNQALISSDALPVNIRIRNTGTSAIERVEATINGEKFVIPDSYVAPRKTSNFTVQYPIDDNFDGYITSTVEVVYNNIFNHKVSRRRGARSNVRQRSEQIVDRVSVGEVDCYVVSQSIEDNTNTFLVELRDLANMRPDMAVCLGIYGHPNGTEPITNEAEVIFPATDFVQMADARKAYATVSISGITEPLKAYVNARVVEKDDDNPARRRSRNCYRVSTHSKWMSVASRQSSLLSSNASSVNLFPTDDHTGIERPEPIEVDADSNHRITISREDSGIKLDGLTNGEQIRIFNADGQAIFNKIATSATMSVPLRQAGVYLIASESESYKFRF